MHFLFALYSVCTIFVAEIIQNLKRDEKEPLYCRSDAIVLLQCPRRRLATIVGTNNVAMGREYQPRRRVAGVSAPATEAHGMDEPQWRVGLLSPFEHHRPVVCLHRPVVLEDDSRAVWRRVGTLGADAHRLLVAGKEHSMLPPHVHPARVVRREECADELRCRRLAVQGVHQRARGWIS